MWLSCTGHGCCVLRRDALLQRTARQSRQPPIDSVGMELLQCLCRPTYYFWSHQSSCSASLCVSRFRFSSFSSVVSPGEISFSTTLLTSDTCRDLVCVCRQRALWEKLQRCCCAVPLSMGSLILSSLGFAVIFSSPAISLASLEMFLSPRFPSICLFLRVTFPAYF